LKPSPKKPVIPPARKPKPDWNRYIYALIILAYAFIAVLTPNLNTYDSNGPEFLSLSILNILSFGFLVMRKKLTADKEFLSYFFRNRIGLVYSLFLLIALLSFVKSVNVLESILTFSKLFTVFSAAFILSILFRSDKRLLKPLAVVMTLLLIFDCMTVFYQMLKMIEAGQVPDPSAYFSIYSNKNILTAAIFIKIPFAIWLLSFGRIWWKALGLFAFICALPAVFFMRTRSAYLGLFFLLMAFILFTCVRYFRRKEFLKLSLLLFLFILIISGAFVLFTGTGKAFIPQKWQEKKVLQYVTSVDIVSRLKTISEEKAGLRMQTLVNTGRLIKRNPFLGTGIGNWKLEIRKYENLHTPDYLCMYRAHNDFMENTAETGIIGGLMFLAIFILIWLNFTRAFFKHGATEDSYKYLFLPAFGMLCYFFDAFFNFPSDRPEIASLFALFVGSAIAFTPSNLSLPSPILRLTSHVLRPTSHVLRLTSYVLRLTSYVSRNPSLILKTLLITFMLASIYVLFLNFRSLKLQRIVAQDIARGMYVNPSEMFVNGFPGVPTVTIECEPIAVSKSRYLANEGKYNEAIALLTKDRSNPYDTRRELFLSLNYMRVDNTDSVLKYARFVYDRKPLYYPNVHVLCTILDNKGRYAEGAQVLDNYLALTQSGDQNIISQRNAFAAKAKILRVEGLYYPAMNFYERKKFDRAENLFTGIIAREPDLTNAWEFRARCYLNLKQPEKAIADIEHVFTTGNQKPDLMNLRGLAYNMLGNKAAACRDFDAAITLGDKDAKLNKARYCK